MGNELAYIRQAYGVPAHRGQRVRVTFATGSGGPREGRITRGRHARVMVRLDGNTRSTDFHPVWGLEYLDEEGGVIEVAAQAEVLPGDTHAEVVQEGYLRRFMRYLGLGGGE